MQNLPAFFNNTLVTKKKLNKNSNDHVRPIIQAFLSFYSLFPYTLSTISQKMRPPLEKGQCELTFVYDNLCYPILFFFPIRTHRSQGSTSSQKKKKTLARKLEKKKREREREKNE